MKMKKLNISFIAIAAGMLLLSSCYKAKNSPGWEYMGQTDMYRSPSYKAYENNPFFNNGLTMQNQVEGTIPHSFDREKMVNYMPFNYSNNLAGRDSAIAYLKNPLAKTEAHLKDGEYLYNIYCIACHGKKGMGDGPVVTLLAKRDNMGLLPPAYNSDQLKNATEGQIFYATQYGKGNMGPYAAQLSAFERWQVVMYVQTLQGGGAASDSTSAPTDTIAK
jgi:mono/diheme cytochrome c family protein